MDQNPSYVPSDTSIPRPGRCGGQRYGGHTQPVVSRIRSDRVLYAVNELKTFDGGFGGSVSAFSIALDTGDLAPLNTVATHGTDPCHLTVDRTGRYLLVANYGSGQVSALPIRAGGWLAPACQVVQHVGSSVYPVRQTGPHAHCVAVDDTGMFVFVADLGMDQIVIYCLDLERGMLVPHDPPFVASSPGAGPRQIVLHPDGSAAYTINEIASSVTVYAYPSPHSCNSPRGRRTTPC